MGETTFKTDDGQLISTIQKSVETKLIDLDGRTYSTRQIFDPPRPAEVVPLATHTLQSVVDYLANDGRIDHVVPASSVVQPADGLAVHVMSPHEVRIVANLTGRWHQRHCYLMAQCIQVIGPTFQFGRFYELEEFIIALRSLFAPTDDVAALIKILGRVEDSAVKVFADDGLSQTVTATVGIVTKQDVQVPTVVTLIPFRTFPEIFAPASDFFLRLQRQDDDPPLAALFETDGGKWKIEAITTIADFVKDKLAELSVQVPVLS